MTDQVPPQVEPPNIDERHFQEYYFAHCCGRPYRRDEEWMRFFGGIAERIAIDIRPQRVLDAGCALGLLVEALRARQIDAYGIDLSTYAIEHVDASVRPHCRQGSIADTLTDRYDLIVCIEVVEHMPATAADAAIANLCAHADDVLFSSSPVDYGEPTHINVRPPEAWAELFARHGFYRDVDFDASFVTPWTVRYRRSREPIHRIVRALERRFAELAIERSEARARALQLQADLERLERDAKRDAAALESARQQLAQAHDRIFHMERSWFWKARLAWLRLRGRPNNA